MLGGRVRSHMGWSVGVLLAVTIAACGAKMESSDSVPEGSGGSSAGRRSTGSSPPKTASGGRPTGNPSDDVVSCGGPGYDDDAIRRLQAAEDPRAIQQSFEDSVQAFVEQRARYLLY